MTRRIPGPPLRRRCRIRRFSKTRRPTILPRPAEHPEKEGKSADRKTGVFLWRGKGLLLLPAALGASLGGGAKVVTAIKASAFADPPVFAAIFLQFQKINRDEWPGGDGQDPQR